MRIPAPVASAILLSALSSIARPQDPGISVIAIPSRRTAPPVDTSPEARLRALNPQYFRPPPPRVTRVDDAFYSLYHSDLPAPNDYRDASGRPGARYWQQRADYVIRATLDTTTQRISGTVTIRYTNNAPTALDFVWLQLDQNLFRLGSEASELGGGADWGGGIDVDQTTADGRPAPLELHGTMARLDLPRPVAAGGGQVTLALHYVMRIPTRVKRMGRDGTLYEIAQWYPRLAVYDDVRGWNTDPYLGDGEFYLEYGDIEYAVTVPAGYVVAGTGLLQNPGEVLSGVQRQRLADAAHSTTIVAVITRAEAEAARSTARAGTKTWRFRAERVRDVAWAAAPDYRWDATSTGPIDGNAAGVLCQAYYQSPRAGRAWEGAAEETQWTIRHYSALVFPYPYPQATSVAGPEGGMEYPMFAMVPYGQDDPKSIFFVLNHEQGHEWFPMLVGSNERRYAWMDEGFNTYINVFAAEQRAAAQHEPVAYPASPSSLTFRSSVPLMTHADHGGMGVAYPKPAAALLVLRDQVVGRATFDRAFRTYVRRWAYKHPTPADFFRTVEEVSGQDLTWFWQGFFYSNDVLDIAIDTMRAVRDTSRPADTRFLSMVSLKRLTSVRFPVALRFKLADGTTRDMHLPVGVFAWSDTYDVTIAAPVPAVGARLWPQQTSISSETPLGGVPDANPSNDVWGDAPDSPPAHEQISPTS